MTIIRSELLMDSAIIYLVFPAAKIIEWLGKRKIHPEYETRMAQYQVRTIE